MKTILSTLLLALAFSVQASDLPKVLLYGSVTEGAPEAVLSPSDTSVNTFVKEVLITVTCEDEVISQYTNRSTGFYSVILESGRNYTVSFSKDGFISKSFEIKTDEVVPLEKKKSFKMYTDVTLFTKPNKGDFSSYEKLPVAKCNYNDEKERMEWDMEYARMAFNHFVNEVKSMNSTASVSEE